MNAYDYDNQRWVNGKQAVDLLRRQANESLSLLRSTSGARYAATMGYNRTEAIHATRKFLAELA